MAIFKRKGRTPEEGPAPRQIMASSLPLTGPGVQRVAVARGAQTTEQWQNDAWYFYDSIGEFRGPVNWIANAISKADIFAAEMDPETGLVTGPTDNTQAQAAAAACLGGISKRAQLQYILAVCWQVPGEAFVIIRPRGTLRGKAQPDEWLVLSGQKVKAKGQNWTYQDPETLLWVTVNPTRDRMIRVWSPHPNDQSKADTAARSAIPVMREIEKSSMSLAATLDSRLATAGLHAVPQEMDFPGGSDSTLAQHITDVYVEHASASLANPGMAEARVPLVFSMPSEMIAPFVEGRMYPDVTMDQAVIDLRASDLSRLASALDMPKEVAEGTQGQSNHWSAWQVEESTYKIFIEPLLDRVGDAFTEHWFRPALTAMGVTNPENYTLAWDTTGIVASPDATSDANHLHEIGLISDDYRRELSGIPDSAIPDEEESRKRLLERIVIGAPTLLSDPQVAEMLLGIEIAPAAAGVSPVAIEGADAVRDAAPDPAALPATRGEEPEAEPVPDGLVAAAELIVFDALSRAGGRLLTREHRGQYGSTPKHELHTVIAAAHGDIDRLMGDSFLWADRVAESFGIDPALFSSAVQEHVRYCLWSGKPHTVGALRLRLRP